LFVNEIAQMDNSRSQERSQVIRLSMVLFSVLAVLSFALARIPW